METTLADSVDTNGLYVALQETITEHRNAEGPWETLIPPEQLVLEHINGMENRLRFLLFGCALDYARDADVHWRSMEELYVDVNWVFDPRTVARIGPGVIEMPFSSVGVRFWRIDAATWCTIAESIATHHQGMVTKLLEHCNYDAVDLLEHLQSDSTESYPYLGGDKIAPMFIRMVDEYVVQLDRIGSVTLPVDVQVDKVTRAIMPDVFDVDDEDERLDMIREFWTAFSDWRGLPLYRVDEALWQLGRHWDDWGEAYLTEKLLDAGVDCPLTTTSAYSEL